MKIFKHSSFPGRVRRSAALISTAILLSTTAYAEVAIGRLPSTSMGGGEVIGAKPNVFLIIDNSKSMTGSAKKTELDPDGNRLQQTAGALIAALPQLEGKVRLGYTTIFRGVQGNKKSTQFAGQHCKNYKLNGNVNRLNQFIPGLKADLQKNKNYFLKEKGGKDYYIFGTDGTDTSSGEDLIFGEYGSGYGDTVPRDFKENYARYIYAWLGGMCFGSTNDKDSLPYTLVPQKSQGYPPYADLKDPEKYVTAAAKSGNKYSFPLFNFFGSNIIKKSHKPLIDMYTRVLGEVSDENFLCSIVSSRKGPRCGYTNLNAERNSPKNLSLRGFPSAEPFNFFNYDAYADAVPEHEGYPDDKNPKSCRKNYTIMIAYGPYGAPDSLKNNSNVGVGQWGIFGAGGSHSWEMPDGHDIPTSGALGDYTRIYRHLPLEGIKGSVREIPKSSYKNNGKTYNVQGTAGRFLLSKLILETYYGDLRSNLVDDVTPFYAQKSARPDGIPGVNGGKIPIMWDRKNDTATWQHMAFFALGFTNSFPTWQKAAIYQKNFSDLDPEGGILEGYFRAIENGSIYSENSPLYDWGRGGFGLESEPMNYYIYKKPGNVSPPTEKVVIADDYPSDHYLEAFGALNQMDYAKAGVVGRGGAYNISDYNSIKKIIGMISDRIETAMAQGITGGAASSGRVTASSQAAGGNGSVLFTTYIDEATLSGNIFTFKNCPLIQERIQDDQGNTITNPEWINQKCGSRLWNAATALNNSISNLGKNTITAVKNGAAGALTGERFAWDNLDADLKTALKNGDDDAMGQARVEWVNGKLKTAFSDEKIKNKLRARPVVVIPEEGQTYKMDENGDLVKDAEGNYVKAEPTSIPNRIGEIVYASPKAVDNRGTLGAAHPLNNTAYADFVKNTVKKRKPLVMAGANDGHLYAFSTSSESRNAELAFSYIPRAVIENGSLAQVTKPDLTSANAPSLVNGPFSVRDAQVDGKWGTYVVGTLGVGGGTVYALDISDGEASPGMFKWEVNLGDANIMADPRIVWLRKPCFPKGSNCAAEGKWVVLLPSGYNAQDVALIVLDLADGHELARIKTGAKYTLKSTNKDGTLVCALEANANPQNSALNKTLVDLGDAVLPKGVTCDNGLGPLTVFDADSDSGADYVFTGDLLGNVWKFDLTGFYDAGGSQASDLNSALKVAYNSPLFIAQTPVEAGTESTRQSITTMIELDDGAYGEGSMLYFGTGRLFNQAERKFSQRQSFYSVWDIPRYVEQSNIGSKFKLPLRRNPQLVPGAGYDFLHYEVYVINKSNINNDKNTFLKNRSEILGVKRLDQLTSSKYLAYNLAGQNAASINDKVVGWIIDFPQDSGLERVLERGRVFEDILFFSSFTPKTDDDNNEESCTPQRGSVGGAGRFYMVDRMTGAQLTKSPFDFTGDGKQDDADAVKVDPTTLGVSSAEEAGKLGYSVNTDGTVNASVAGVKIGRGNGDFLSVTGILERAEQARKSAKKLDCDYNRQIIFPSTVDPDTGNPLVLSSCNKNRYRVWKQPAIE